MVIKIGYLQNLLKVFALILVHIILIQIASTTVHVLTEFQNSCITAHEVFVTVPEVHEST